jgi:hypothetical protein
MMSEIAALRRLYGTQCGIRCCVTEDGVSINVERAEFGHSVIGSVFSYGVSVRPA